MNNEQNNSNIFLHKLSGLHIVYKSLNVINPVNDTTTNLYESKLLLKIPQNIIIKKILNITVIPLGTALRNTLAIKSLSTLL